MTAPNLDAMQMMNMGMYYGTNGIDAQGAINMVGTMVGGQTYNDIAWFANSIQSLGNGTPEQKAMTIQMGVSKLLSWFSSGMGVKEGNTTAPTETAQHKKAAQDVIDTQKQEMDRLNSDITAINNEIQERLDAINQEIQEIEANGKELTEQQKAAKAKQEEINKKQEELNNASTDEEKVRILNEILTLSGELKTIVETMTSATDSLKTSNDEVESSDNDINELTEQAGNVVITGTDAVSQGVSDGVAALSNGQSDLQISGQDTKAGIQLEARAATTAIGTFGLGSGQATQMQLDATGFFTGAASRLSGGTAVLSLSNLGIGNWNNTLPLLTNFENGIGQYTSLSSGYVGDFSNNYTSFMDMITTIGSQTSSMDNLETAATSDITVLENQPETDNGEASDKNLQTNQVKLEEIEA